MSAKISNIKNYKERIKEKIRNKKVDETYAKFLIKSLKLREIFENILKKPITPREYDKILIHFANSKPNRNFLGYL